MEKSLNMLTFYDPNNPQVIEEAKSLINHSKIIMEAIIDKWIDVLNEERKDWTLEQFKSYPNQDNVPFLVKKLKTTIEDLATKLAAIALSNANTATNIEEEIRKQLSQAFFTYSFNKMDSFLTETVNNIVENHTKTNEYSSQYNICENEEETCVSKLKRYYTFMHVPFEINKFPYETLGFGTYLAYFSRLLSSSKSNVDFFNSWKITSGEKIVRGYMNLILTNLAQGQNMANMSTFELARLLHQNPDEGGDTTQKFALPLQNEFGCIGDVVKAYEDAWIAYAKVKFMI